MEILVLAAVLGYATYTIRARYERRRIAILGSVLGRYQIEKLMEALTEGYLRALGEADLARREQVWALLRISEVQLATQFAAFAQDLARVDARHLRVSKLALGIPFASSLFPAATFDLRRLMAVHAEGIAQTVQNSRQLSPKDKAYTLSAELFLMQHTCHWYCKSRTVASARLLVRHKTAWAQVLDGVSPQTRAAYRTITGV